MMPFDIRAEVIIANLVEEGHRLEDISIRPNGLFKRNYHWDIERIREIDLPNTEKKMLEVAVNREGLYDKLPQDLFHAPLQTDKEGRGGQTDKDGGGGSPKSREPKEIESAARNFFLPFENEFYRQRIYLEAEERNSLFETNASVPGHLLEDIWGLPKVLDHKEKGRLGMLMPILHRIRGNMEMIAEAIGRVTGDQVSIVRTGALSYSVTDGARLGASRLGDDMVLDGLVSTMLPSYTMMIRPDQPDRLADYVPGGSRIGIYEYLSRLFFPLEQDVVFQLGQPALEDGVLIEL